MATRVSSSTLTYVYRRLPVCMPVQAAEYLQIQQLLRKRLSNCTFSVRLGTALSAPQYATRSSPACKLLFQLLRCTPAAQRGSGNAQDLENTAGSWDLYGKEDERRYPQLQNEFFERAANPVISRQGLLAVAGLGEGPVCSSGSVAPIERRTRQDLKGSSSASPQVHLPILQLDARGVKAYTGRCWPAAHCCMPLGRSLTTVGLCALCIEAQSELLSEHPLLPAGGLLGILLWGKKGSKDIGLPIQRGPQKPGEKGPRGKL